jgi:hypothetical protein
MKNCVATLHAIEIDKFKPCIYQINQPNDEETVSILVFGFSFN